MFLIRHWIAGCEDRSAADSTSPPKSMSTRNSPLLNASRYADSPSDSASSGASTSQERSTRSVVDANPLPTNIGTRCSSSAAALTRPSSSVRV